MLPQRPWTTPWSHTVLLGELGLGKRDATMPISEDLLWRCKLSLPCCSTALEAKTSGSCHGIFNGDKRVRGGGKAKGEYSTLTPQLMPGLGSLRWTKVLVTWAILTPPTLFNLTLHFLPFYKTQNAVTYLYLAPHNPLPLWRCRHQG